MFSLAFSGYCFCLNKLNRSEIGILISDCCQQRNILVCETIVFQKCVKYIYVWYTTKLYQYCYKKNRIDKLSIQYQISKYPTSFSYQVNCVCFRWKIHLCCLPKTLVSYFSIGISAMKWYQQISEMDFWMAGWNLKNLKKINPSLAWPWPPLKLVDQKQWIMLHFSATSIPPSTPLSLFWSKSQNFNRRFSTVFLWARQRWHVKFENRRISIWIFGSKNAWCYTDQFPYIHDLISQRKFRIRLYFHILCWMQNKGKRQIK